MGKERGDRLVGGAKARESECKRKTRSKIIFLLRAVALVAISNDISFCGYLFTVMLRISDLKKCFGMTLAEGAAY